MTATSAGGPVPTLPYDRDEVLLRACRETGRPQLSVYPWTDVAVVIGRGGHQERELEMEAIRADGVPLLQRPGGGCSVVLDAGNVIVAVVLPLPGIGGITGAFAAISAWLADGLASCGIPGVMQQGVSDLTLGDRKIGGSCVRRTRGLLYYSTTLLVDPALGLVERYLLHPPREPAYRGGRDHRAFMGALHPEPWSGTAAALAASLDPLLTATLGTLFDELSNPPGKA